MTTLLAIAAGLLVAIAAGLVLARRADRGEDWQGWDGKP